ncbi:MAG: ankyrin repeat domain-containing protein [Desulfomonile tiedjei]|uniref:Ankyrin repeat domain-containing protein n=1 Tax=Desulfomonile tiedjei TaxID=2358 RepID=A0A9D6V974_9BACT|nr:ankyrin repeat domain-containing protein [Desulfomonile tiedjei]
MGEQYTGSTRVFSLQKMGELLDQGVPLESIDKDGKTFLRHACADGKSDIAESLLNRGADPNSRDNEGKTPLMSASMTGRFKIVNLLLQYGADPKVETPSGDSALKMAQRWGKKEIVQALLESIEQGPALRPVTASGTTSEQSTHAPVESTVAEPIPEKRKEVPVSEIAAPPSVVEAEVVHAVVKPVAGRETPTSGETGAASITMTVVDVTVRQPEPPVQQDDFKMPELTTDEYIQALEKMKQSPKDRIGILGSLGATGLGAAAGAAASGSIAAALGITTLLGSSTLGSIVGGVLVTTTPVGWVIGSAAAAAAIGYGVSKLIRSGARADVIKEMNMNDLHEEIEKRIAAAEKTGVVEEKFKGLVESLQLLVRNNRISQSDCTELLAGVEGGFISYEYAFGTVEKLSQQQEVRTDAQ